MRRRPPAVVLAVAALAGTAALLSLVLFEIRDRPLADLLQPGRLGPTATVLAHDFPRLTLPAGAGNDGQQFYAMARDPLHPTETGLLLDRPRYRLQRPGYPLLAWILHPDGGGDGLVAAMLAVNAAAAALAVASLGWWASRNHRSPAWGLLAILLPGAFISMRISCADLLAGGLAVLATALFIDGSLWAALFVGVAAAITKETGLIMVVAIAASVQPLRPRRAIAFVAAPLAIVAVIWVALLITFPHAGRQYGELGAPLRGLADSTRYWRDTGDWKPAAAVLGTIALAFVALRLRRRSPFAAATGAYLVLALFQAMGTLAFWTSAPRTLYPLGICSVAALLDRRPPADAGVTLTAPRPAPA